jgi:hypothetical protein
VLLSRARNVNENTGGLTGEEAGIDERLLTADWIAFFFQGVLTIEQPNAA